MKDSEVGGGRWEMGESTAYPLTHGLNTYIYFSLWGFILTLFIYQRLRSPTNTYIRIHAFVFSYITNSTANYNFTTMYIFMGYGLYSNWI